MQNYQKFALRMLTPFIGSSEILIASEYHRRPWISYLKPHPLDEYRLFVETRMRVSDQLSVISFQQKMISDQLLYARVSLVNKDWRLRLHARLQLYPGIVSDQRGLGNNRLLHKGDRP